MLKTLSERAAELREKAERAQQERDNQQAHNVVWLDSVLHQNIPLHKWEPPSHFSPERSPEGLREGFRQRVRSGTGYTRFGFLCDHCRTELIMTELNRIYDNKCRVACIGCGWFGFTKR